VRDLNTSTGVNESGLSIAQTGCQVLDGAQALSLSRSRYFQYYSDGEWHSDLSSDLGRIQRQNLVIAAALDKAKSSAYNPLRLNSLLTSVVHDFSKDNGLSPDDLFSLAERYHAFSGSDLAAYTLPTQPAVTSGGSDVEVVEPDAAAAMITQFLGGPFGAVSTPPIDAYGDPLPLTPPTTTPTTAAPVGTTAPSGGAATATTIPPPTIPSFDPTPC
jgi:hypothetical protein